MTRSTLAATAAATALAASAGAAVTGLQVEYNGLVGGRHVWSVYAVSDDPNHVMLNVFGHTVVAGSMSGVQHSDFGGGTWSPNFTILPDQAAIDSFVTVSGLSGADASTNLDSGFSGGGAGSVIPDGAGWITANPLSPILFTGGRIKIMQVAGEPFASNVVGYRGSLSVTYRQSMSTTTNLVAHNLTYSIGACPAQVESASSGQMAPFSLANPREWTASGIPASSAGAALTVTARGQLGSTTRFLTIKIDGATIASNVFGAGSGAGTCTATPSVATFQIPPAQFQQLTADGALTVRIEPSTNATSDGCSNADLQVRLDYVRDTVDCDSNGADDECQIASLQATFDCNGNGVVDSCESVSMEVDCDHNGVPDSCDIARGAENVNSNGLPDVCEIRYGDLNLDGQVNGADLAGLLAVWGMPNPPYGDLDGDGHVGGADLAFLLARWGATPWAVSPALTSVTPSIGSLGGGTAITLTGAGLFGAPAVSIGGTAATNVQVVNSTTVTAITPPGVAGVRDVSVITAGGIATLVGGFTYVLPPTLVSVSPANGPTSGGTAMTLTGTNLLGTSEVRVGGALATNVQVVNSTTVTAVTPSGTAGARDVTVTTPGGTATRIGGFTYFALPTLRSVSPASGPASGGTTMTLTGTNLLGTFAVRVGGALATNVQVVNSTTVTAVTPSGILGASDVAVTTPGGTVTRIEGFTYATATIPSWATLIEPLPDPAVVTSATLRSAISATGRAWRVRDTATQIEMVLIPPGTFQMGCSPSSQYGCQPDENPVHSVTLTSAFYMGRFEVTQAQWTARIGSNPSHFQSPSAQVPADQVPKRPVERVSWNAIQGFLGATGMRIPTEAEWEYAYRAGTTTAFHAMPGYLGGTNDDALLMNIAWIEDNLVGQTRPVGQKAGNGFGLHDMSGNVWEWVNDRYSGTYYASSPPVNPPGASSGALRVLRGGGWVSGSNGCRSSFRNYDNPSNENFSYGFRVARAP